ncbi:MAG: heavy-metal-associated domain-containing protein [Paracoccaceae bacterium]
MSLKSPPSALRVLLVALLLAVAAPMGLAAAGEKVEYAIGVDGLACPFCAYGIEKQLSRIAGVEAVSTDIESGTVAVTMEEGATLEEAAVTNAVEDAGFTLRSFERKAVGE